MSSLLVHSLPENISINAINVSRSRKRKARKNLSSTTFNLLTKEGEVWHKCLGHLSGNYMNKLCSNSIGINEFVFDKTKQNCEICNKAKMTSKVFNKERDRAEFPYQVIHCDLIQYNPPIFAKKNKYLLVVLDDHTRYLQTFYMCTKSETAECLRSAFRKF